MSQLILILHVLVALGSLALVLLQHGKGADAGAAFGSGASNTMFGSVGSMPFLMKLTALLAAIFFATSLLLSYFTSSGQRQNEQMYQIPVQTNIPETAPAPSKEDFQPSVPTKPESQNEPDNKGASK